jgi:hypothetical protein
LQSLWQSERSLLDRIVEQHDVSKHRQTIFAGGRARSDPPIGFYESLGIPDTPKIRAQFWPMAEIKLQNEPRLPRAARSHNLRRISSILKLHRWSSCNSSTVQDKQH